MAGLSPETSKKWLGVLWPVLERGGPVLSLILLLLGAVQVWYLLGELARLQRNNEYLVKELLREKEVQVTLVSRYAACQPQHHE